jgi:hypothetical protein
MSSIVADGATAAEAKATKKREQNRKKKARQKAKKLVAAQTLEEKMVSSGYENKTTRQEAAKGRGQGMFTNCEIVKGEVIVRARPALSTVFDPFVSSVCAFCFKPASTVGTVKVEFALNKKDGKVGLFLGEKKIRGAIRCVINGCAEASANSLSGVMPDDVLESVAGTQLAAGDGALSRCLELISQAGDGEVDALFPVTVRRVALQPCVTCSRAAICIDCDRAGHGAWHSSYECPAFVQLPDAVKKGESSPIRMMLRYKSIAVAGEWTPTILTSSTEAGGGGCKEPLAMVHTLQANTDVVPPKQREALSKMTGVPPKVVSLLIGQIRGNAASIERGGAKVGCALSAHMGYANHDCTPNAEATVDAEGLVTLRALSNIPVGDEVCISYIDVNQHVEQRLAILESHYEFSCKCLRCTTEKRAWLKAKAKNRGEEYLLNNSILARNGYIHDSTSAKGGASTSVKKN